MGKHEGHPDPATKFGSAKTSNRPDCDSAYTDIRALAPRFAFSLNGRADAATPRGAGNC